MNNYTCPVCGNGHMLHPATDYNICPCCRTEFGVSDYSWTHEELRQDWIENGAKWMGKYVSEPPGWDAGVLGETLDEGIALHCKC